MRHKVISNGWTVASETTVRLHPSIMAGFACCIGLVLLTGCNSTHIKSTPNAAGMSSAPIRNVTVVGMEATGIYWKPTWDILEGRFELAGERVAQLSPIRASPEIELSAQRAAG